MLVLYENVRDPSQWTVERMDNKLGHVRGILRWRVSHAHTAKTIHFERYILTKRLKNITKTSGPDET
jgi:hypothetical protein